MKLIKYINLFILITLFAGCNMLFEPEIGVETRSVSQVHVNIDGNARTILPSISNYSKYVITAESEDGLHTLDPVDMIEGYASIIELTFDVWIITVTAYIDADGTEYPVASGSTRLTVNNNWHWINIVITAPVPEGKGTFVYTLNFPNSANASVSLKSFPGMTEVFKDTGIVSGETNRNEVNSGIYFLTVTAAANGKTVTRNEIVHIYQQSESEANYTFSVVDFAYTNLNFYGTIKFLVNGVQPDSALIFTDLKDAFGKTIQGYLGGSVDFAGIDGSADWSIRFNNLYGANNIDFRIGPTYEASVLFHNMPVPMNEAEINLGDAGTYDLIIDELPSGEWVNGNLSENENDLYFINVTAGTTYHFWLNHYIGDGSKTLFAEISGYYNPWDGFYETYAWDDPISFFAHSSGIFYINVSSTGNTGTYAIAYSTDYNWHNNSFDSNKIIPLNADLWVNGEITEEYAVDWYSINVTAEEMYFLWWNNGFYGDGSKTLGTDVYAYTEDMDIIPLISCYNNNPENERAWDDPVYFIAKENGTVYIKIRAYGGGWSIGTYAVSYSTDYNWHNNSGGFGPVPLDHINITRFGINFTSMGDLTQEEIDAWQAIINTLNSEDLAAFSYYVAKLILVPVGDQRAGDIFVFLDTHKATMYTDSTTREGLEANLAEAYDTTEVYFIDAHPIINGFERAGISFGIEGELSLMAIAGAQMALNNISDAKLAEFTDYVASWTRVLTGGLDVTLDGENKAVIRSDSNNILGALETVKDGAENFDPLLVDYIECGITGGKIAVRGISDADKFKMATEIQPAIEGLEDLLFLVVQSVGSITWDGAAADVEFNIIDGKVHATGNGVDLLGLLIDAWFHGFGD